LEFPAKPKGQLQKENDTNIVKMIKEKNGKSETNNTSGGTNGKHLSPHALCTRISSLDC